MLRTYRVHCATDGERRPHVRLATERSRLHSGSDVYSSGGTLSDRMKVVFSDHADKKIAVLGSHAVKITRQAVEETVLNPKRMPVALEGAMITDRPLDGAHTLTVVFVREERQITFYPARKGRHR
jgi:hypothetical protein